MQSTRLSIHAPSNFNFWRTVYSHGWCVLAPFSCNVEAKTLQRVLTLADGNVVSCVLSAGSRRVDIVVQSRASLSDEYQREIASQLRTCLRLNEDFSGFHHEARRFPRYRWIATSNSGRMLRSPTVFEDVVKMICTTNCTWALTTVIVNNLVRVFGSRFDSDALGFPEAHTIAGASEKTLRTEIRAGYRAPYLLQLAQGAASGTLDLEEWRSSRATTEELFKKMLTVKGIGPYAAGNLLRLVGRYDYLALDSWVRSQYYALHHGGRKVKDSTIERHYKQYGTWRGLFFWLEMTRDWHDEKYR